VQLTAEHLLRRFKMAASGATPIILYHSTTGAAVPSNTNLAPGELAVNIADMKLYCENDSGVVTLLSSADAAAGNFTTVDTTNIEVTNIKAKDGTAAGSIADSTGVVTLASSVLTTTDINGGTIDGAVIGGASAAAGSFTTLNTSGAVVFNDAGADVDFRVESDTVENALFLDGATGNLGIGTGSPASDTANERILQVNAPTTFSTLSLSTSRVNTNGDNIGKLSFDVLNNTATYRSRAQITSESSGSTANKLGATLQFFTASDNAADATERMRIDSSGNVGIGTSTPGDKLDIRGGGLQVQQGASNSANFSITTSSTPSSGTTLNASWSGAGSQGPLIFDLGGTEAMRITSAGAVEIANGNLVFSTNGTGIDFSASAGGGATSSLLDDYEEGTFTITFTPTTSGTATANASYNTMSYTKIGNMVTIFGNPRVSSVGSPVGELYLNGLPFAVASTTNISRGGVSITYLVFGTGYKAVPILALETTTYLFIFTTSVGATVAAGDEMLISFSYRTT
jgi:hypothetical protein